MKYFFWLDDEPARLRAAQNMEDGLQKLIFTEKKLLEEPIDTDVKDFKITFFDLKGKSLEKELDDIVKSNDEEPSLIILDHNLQDANRGVFKKGSTAAAFIREHWPECPIVCVTGEDVHNLNNQQKNLYEQVFPISNIAQYYPIIKSIADSFYTARENRPTNSGELISLLGTPEIDIDKLISVLPTSLKDNFDDKTLIVELSRWVRGVLLERPGFLYNEIWLATLIGIKHESLPKVSECFEKAKYKGLFANDTEVRWWKSEVLEILYDISEIKGLPWQRGRGITGITSDDYSCCFASGEDYPEIVAFVDESSEKEEQPMKIKYTEIHPEYERLLHFEDIRLMKYFE